MSGFPPVTYLPPEEYTSLMSEFEPSKIVNTPKEILPTSHTFTIFIAGLLGALASLLAILEYIRVHF